jgi:hypothetical protein
MRKVISIDKARSLLTKERALIMRHYYCLITVAESLI